jgi:outer membrane protein assembly factor BamB
MVRFFILNMRRNAPQSNESTFLLFKGRSEWIGEYMDRQLSEDNQLPPSESERCSPVSVQRQPVSLREGREPPLAMKTLRLLGGIVLLLVIGMSLEVIFFRTPLGSKKWSFQTGSVIVNSPAVVNNLIYVGSNNGKVYALDARDGQERWSVQTGIPSRSYMSSRLVVTNDMVYVINSGILYALDAESGQEKWSFVVPSDIALSPVVANGLVYVGSAFGRLSALDAKSGQEQWFFHTAGTIESSVAVGNGLVYVSAGENLLYALDAVSGRQRWLAFVREYELFSSPMVADGMVSLVSSDGVIESFDAQTGREGRSYQMGRGVHIHSTPIVADGIIYTISSDTVYAFDAQTGREQWSYQTGDYILASPTVTKGIVYVGSEDHKLYALNRASGRVEWLYQAAGRITSSPTIVGESVYVGSDDGNVYAIQAPG